MENTLTTTTDREPSKLDECLEMYREGAGDVEIADHLGMTLKQFHSLCEDNDGFREFVERGSTVAQAWWWRQARVNLKNKAFNSSMWFTNMKNRYGWADKMDTNTTADMDVSIDHMQRQLAQALKDLGKKNPELVKSFRILDKVG